MPPTELSPQHVTFFETFGFLKLPQLFGAEIAEITAAFEGLFADPDEGRMETHEAVHGRQRRLIMPLFLERHPVLEQLKHDPRILAVATQLLGDVHHYSESDGNIFFCETYWHPDIYGATLARRNIKISLYLDPLDGASGALRFVPGTHFLTESFGAAVRRGVKADATEATFGVPRDELPAWVVKTEPGDVVVSDFRTIHGTFNGTGPRRHLSMNFTEGPPDPERAAALEALRRPSATV